MYSKIEVEFQGQIETILKQSLADLDIKVMTIFQKLRMRPGAKLSPKSFWAAFFTTDATFTTPEVVKKIMSRCSIEVFFKEAKTMLRKDPSQSLMNYQFTL